MRKKNQLYECELKSKAISDKGMGSLIMYFSGGNKKTIISNMKIIYPDYTKEEDKPVVHITPISYGEYQNRLKTNLIPHKRRLVQTTTTKFIEAMEAENETLENKSASA